MTRPCDELARRIGAYNFAIYELELYLDTHPDDCHAIRARENCMCARNELIEKYEKLCGKWELTASGTTATDHWQWICGPWPWEYHADC